MVRSGGTVIPSLLVGAMLATMLLPDLMGAGPVAQPEREEVTEVASEEKTESISEPEKLVRNRRNIAYYKRLPDFWAWYKYYMDTHNQEGIENMDRVYLAYLQSKHRSEEGPTFNHYLTHLSEIYKACANSDDPDCIAESTSKPKAKVVMPAPVKSAVVRVCNPYVDPYCLFAVPPAPAEEEPSPSQAPLKVPAPILTPLLPMPLKTPMLPVALKTPPAYYHYAPVLEPFLSAEQRAELLRICNPSDTECLQYHLRAAYGYKPALSPVPSYAHLGCDPAKDPYCKPKLVVKAPTGLYHLYPTCNPEVDPFCVPGLLAPAPLMAEKAGEAPKEQHCNPLFEEGCNPLTATKLAGLTKPVLEFVPKDEPAPLNLACDPRYDPYCLMGSAAALRKPPPALPQFQTRHRLGIQGKTKEGYDCYVFYDKDCTPVESQDLKADVSSAKPQCHPYDPNCGIFAAGAAAPVARDGIIEPNPHCDPEIDFNCRLRRADPADEPKDEPAQQESGHGDASHGDASPSYAVPEYAIPRFEDFLRGYMGQYKK